MIGRNFLGICAIGLGLLGLMIFGGGLVPSPVLAASSYYLDCSAATNGSGTQASPWNSLSSVNGKSGGFVAGDVILLKAGTTCNGQLWPKGSGNSASPIKIDKYGTGNQPLIQGGGTVSATVYLSNQQYWEIQNLEITNNATTHADLKGVWVTANDAGTLNHIYLRYLNIHDVYGCAVDTCKLSGGIIVNATSPSVVTKFNDLIIEGNTISKTWWGGIQTGSASNTDTNYFFTNVKVRNNYLSDIALDGIILRASVSPLIEYNIAANVSTYTGTCQVPIWTRSTTDAIVQYNEAYGAKNTCDGFGYDSDLDDRRAVFQYNYSHDNNGLMLVMFSSQNAVLRYNISQNDANAAIGLGGPNTKIYNNTIYTKVPIFEDVQSSAGGSTVSNNIFYLTGSANFFKAAPAATLTYDHNTYYGAFSGKPADAFALTTDPLFVWAGSGGASRRSVDGYKLLTGSPALGSGGVVSSNGGKDYWGNTVSATTAPNRGAYNGSGISTTAAATTTRNPVADAFVQDGSYTGLNYGLLPNTSLVVKDGTLPDYTRKAYLKFDLSGVSTVSSAKIRVYGGNIQDSTAVTLRAFSVADDTWGESTLNWTNAPARSASELSHVTVTNSLQYYELDVTAFVAGEVSGGFKAASFTLENTGNEDKSLSFNSRENSANPPELVITR